jgi:hypothetical protein
VYTVTGRKAREEPLCEHRSRSVPEASAGSTRWLFETGTARSDAEESSDARSQTPFGNALVRNSVSQSAKPRSRRERNRVSSKCVPKQSLGTRMKKAGEPSSPAFFLDHRNLPLLLLAGTLVCPCPHPPRPRVAACLAYAATAFYKSIRDQSITSPPLRVASCGIMAAAP